MRFAALALSLSCLITPALRAMEPAGTTPILMQVGGTYLGPDMRESLNTDFGYSFGISTLIAESAIVGIPSADINSRYAPDGEGSLTTFEAYYAERALVTDRTWLGLGVGSNFVRMVLDGRPDRQTASERRWGIGAKAMLGYLITDRLFVEATYHYTGKALDLDTASTSLCLGYWF